MDGKGRVGSSSCSSFTELFGTKEPQSASSSGIFASIFPPPSKAVGMNNKHGSSGQSVSCNITRRERTTVFQEERVEPCHLSSSLYYGGQDVYSGPPSSGQAYPVIKKDSREGDDVNENNSQDASRGNWWQGSFYY